MYDDGGAFDGADGEAFGGGIEPLGPDGMMPSGSLYHSKHIMTHKSILNQLDILSDYYSIFHLGGPE